MTARRLAAHGLVTVRDVLLRLPRAYDDLRRETPLAALAALADGAVVLVRGVVRRVHVFPRRLLDVELERDGVTLRARWFRPRPGMSKAFVKGAEVALAGPLRTDAKGARALVHPTNVTAALAARTGAGLGVRPRYAALDGVAARVFERVVGGALARAEAGADAPLEILSDEARARLGVPALVAALRAIHAPADDVDRATLAALLDGRAPAHRRLALEELVTVQAAFLAQRARSGAAAPTPVSRAQTPGVLARVRAALGFSFTKGQGRAVDEIAADLAGARPMQRLLIGD
ncbi:MAG TPA: hypothetical protein VLA14_05525, partial [Polyangia bacterium]|nr:hypothetical protein [Polyangia bacterium]